MTLTAADHEQEGFFTRDNKLASLPKLRAVYKNAVNKYNGKADFISLEMLEEIYDNSSKEKLKAFRSQKPKIDKFHTGAQH